MAANVRAKGEMKGRAEVLARFDVSRETAARLDAYVDLLKTWQQKTNLVAPSTLTAVWERHVADSLQLLALAKSAKIWVDLGSGGGFPGMVLACALEPPAMVHLVESNGKKAAFLREAARVTGAPAKIHARRIEDFAQQFQEDADIVTARALAPMTELLGYVAPLLKTGTALLLKGQDVADELTQAAKYWKIDADLKPSLTDPDGRVVVVRSIRKVG
jgi:16S rRNA (guanine527-N7)-methyltransferase